MPNENGNTPAPPEPVTPPAPEPAPAPTPAPTPPPPLTLADRYRVLLTDLLGKANLSCSIHGEAKLAKVELFPTGPDQGHVSVHFDCGQVDTISHTGEVSSKDNCSQMSAVLKAWRKAKARGQL